MKQLEAMKMNGKSMENQWQLVENIAKERCTGEYYYVIKLLLKIHNNYKPQVPQGGGGNSSKRVAAQQQQHAAKACAKPSAATENIFH